MKLKKTAAIFLTVAAAAGAIGIGATSASAAPLPVTVHSQQVDSTPTMPTSAESWKILGIDLIYDGKTMGAPSPDVKGATNQPMFWGTGFVCGAQHYIMTTSLSGIYTLRHSDLRDKEVATFKIPEGGIEQEGNVLRYTLVDGNQKAELRIALALALVGN